MNFYHHAASILDKLNERKGTIKGLVIGDPKVRDKKKMYALVCETLKYKAILNELIDTTGICQKEKKHLSSRSLTQVLMHDMLFTKRGIPLSINVPHKKAIQGHQARLKAELAKIKIKRGAKTNSDLINEKAKSAVLIPRYVRVNTHRMTMDEAIEAFKKEGYTFMQDAPEDLGSLELKTFCRDHHLDDLLVFAPKTDLHNHPLYVSGHIILQDKASCFPAHVCRPPLNVHAIDACAAPGNKTSHLSALMKNTGRIWAFDLDARRLDLLKRLTGKAGCSNINPVHGSFLDVNPDDPEYKKVEYFLLDPSCSGSGIISRLDHLVDDEDQEQAESDGVNERLAKLAEFQVSVIRHAFKFPKAKRVVYSTCSIHPQENEHVVRTILADNPDFELASRDSVLPTWTRRGVPKEFADSNNNDVATVLADSVVRSDPLHDMTNGFFVACFVRKAASDKPVKRKLQEQEHVEPEVEEQKVEQQEVEQQQQQQPAASNTSNTNKKKRKNKKRKTAVTA
ncbi:s-adenosyl-l-methionine-dependentmethyltransferase [Lichtheimia corymbifera JMRC:FSU:9682]|uniref:S-adenosyl-l-methionine-dependentmethyltransferase n=1 Tax=Lichtheimia corymbifera JMRC:FSU:9682 TaxID=1263082 RepID=A0A068SFJ1_9FUNG|nr:s-adenosyl-l-methionine-dependentmethyltransferase [Lichtheimia corymbifera JMRC:FSU:9682]